MAVTLYAKVLFCLLGTVALQLPDDLGLSALQQRQMQQLRSNPLNLRMHISSNPVLIADMPELHTILQLDQNQARAMHRVYDQYRQQFNDIQALYLNKLKTAKVDPTSNYAQHIIKLSMLAKRDFYSILTDPQTQILLRLNAQMYGARFAFSEAVYQKIRITEQQRTDILSFIMKLRQTNPMYGERKTPEAAYQSDQLISQEIIKQFLTVEQRTQWLLLVGEPFDPEKVRRLAVTRHERSFPHVNQK